jgi:exodeoxyribonuclease VII small subunit
MTKKEFDYKKLRTELDQILLNLNDDSLDVDDVTKQYERGMQIVGELEDYLKTAENKVKKVKAQWEQ